MAKYNLEKYTAADGLGFPLNFRRGNPNPLDNSSVWASLEAAQNYAANDPVAYVGQILTVVVTASDGTTSVKAYSIQDEAGTLKEVGSTPVGDDLTIEVVDGKIQLKGAEAAEAGAQPRMKADGTIEWIVPSTETVEGLQTAVAGLQSDVNDIQEILTPSGEGEQPLLTRVETLEDKMDGTGEGSVAAKIDAKINEFATNVTDDGVVNSYKELIDYVASHGAEAANMAADITALQGLVGDSSVSDQISNAMSGIEAGAQANKIENVKLGETLLDIVEKTVVIPVGAGLKASDEVTIGTDGTLGLGQVSVSKLVQEDGLELVLDGGTSVK